MSSVIHEGHMNWMPIRSEALVGIQIIVHLFLLNFLVHQLALDENDAFELFYSKYEI